MTKRRKLAAWGAIALGLAIFIVWLSIRLSQPRQLTAIAGVILRDDTDVRKQTPIANAQVMAAEGLAAQESRSDGSGAFQLRLKPGVYPGQTLQLQFRHADYHPVDIAQPAVDQIYVIRMKPKPQVETAPPGPVVTLADVRVRYALKARTTMNVGSVAKTFEVVNTGNVPCQGQPPCSPDGKWKANMTSESVDAGEGNEFRNARISCIAGPCAFTRIESDSSSRGGRTIEVSVRNWSDTTTFLIEAEVMHTALSETIRTSHPAIFGPAMSFTLPATAQGPSIEAELNGEDIVFPLGPKLTLSWATCSLKVGADQTKLYRCELKPGHRFQN